MFEFILIAHIWTGILSKYESQSTAPRLWRLA